MGCAVFVRANTADTTSVQPVLVGMVDEEIVFTTNTLGGHPRHRADAIKTLLQKVLKPEIALAAGVVLVEMGQCHRWKGKGGKTGELERKGNKL